MARVLAASRIRKETFNKLNPFGSQIQEEGDRDRRGAGARSEPAPSNWVLVLSATHIHTRLHVRTELEIIGLLVIKVLLLRIYLNYVLYWVDT